MVSNIISCFIELMEGVCIVGVLYCVTALIAYTIIDHIELKKWEKEDYNDRT